jgi:hypothetical protein
VVLLMSLVFGFLIMGGAAALVTTFHPESLAALRADHRRLFGMDAAVAVLAAIGLGVFLNQLDAVLADRFHAQALYALGSPDIIASAAPVAAAVAGALRSMLTSGAVLTLIGLLVYQVRNRWQLALIGLAALFAGLPGEVRTAGEFLLQYGEALVAGACAVLFCLWIARRNYLAYALVLWMIALRTPMMQLFGNANPGLQMQGWALAGALAVSILWAAAPAFGRRAASAG